MVRRVHVLANGKVPGIGERKKQVEEIVLRAGCGIESAPGPETDVIVTLGGDGILLRGVHLARSEATLIMGINFGRVGFLAGRAEDFEARLARVLEGKARVSSRMCLDVSIPGADGAPRDFCLNEVFVFRKGIRIVTATLSRNGEECFRLRCDGVAISTPTGSSAHALAAGGPLVYPETEAVLVLPVNPFTLAWRPTILPPDDRLTLTADGECSVACDGQREMTLPPGQVLSITRARRKVNLVLDGEGSFFRTLHEKFGWSI